MQLPGLPALFFLAYLLILLPWLAFRSHRMFRRAIDGGGALPSRQTIWINTLFSQVVMLTVAWLMAWTIGYPLFNVPRFAAREALAGALTLAAYFALRAIASVFRSEDERRRLLVYAIAPRTPEEWALWSATVLVAATAEEAAYRGIGMAILWYSLGNGYVAALVSSVAFALAHGTQGAKSVAIIFGMAIVMHALVWYTGTLIVAMVVHAVYDFVAGYLIAREARTFDAAGTVPAPGSK
jgi:membrane protease YdiL (CAAX protease family)